MTHWGWRQAANMLPSAQIESIKKAGERSQQKRFQQSHHRQQQQYHQKRGQMNTKQRLIHVDYSIFNDEEIGGIVEVAGTSVTKNNASIDTSNSKHGNVVHRRRKDEHKCNETCGQALDSYDLATDNEQRRSGCSRRHTIVGCHGKMVESQSTPTSRPESRQSEFSTTVTMNPLNPMNASTYSTTTEIIDIDESEEPECAKEVLDKQWQETVNVSDRLALTLEEIVHIRSVMTKAELEGLPVGVRIKEDVERRKVCFLCLRTRFTIFGQWGVQCKLCHRTVCTKCHSKMRIPTEHFRNVPVVLLSPSLMSSPMTSSAPSPSHHAHYARNPGGPSTMMDDGFPKTLMEKLLKGEADNKPIPSSPRINHSTSSTPVHKCGPSSLMTKSMGGITAEEVILSSNSSNRSSIMSRSMEGPKSLPPQSPARPHSNNSTLDRRNRFANAFSLRGNPDFVDPRSPMRGEMMAVCNDCRGLVFEIIRSSRQTRSIARNKALRNLTLDLSPVYKR